MKTSKVFVWVLALALLSSPITFLRIGSAANPVYYSVEPIAVAPLYDVNASANGLETPYWPVSPLGQFFNVEIHLRGATLANVPAGVGGVEIRLNFSQILTYSVPTGSIDMLGQSGGALIGPQSSLLYDKQSGFYDNEDNYATYPSGMPFPNATQYIVAANGTNGPWNATDGLVAIIQFEITGQPSSLLGQPDFLASIPTNFCLVIDGNGGQVSFDTVPGTLHIDTVAPGPPPILVFMVPQSYTGNATMGDLLNYTVLTNVNSFLDVAGYDITVSWNNTLTNLVDVFDGGFLQQGGASTSSWVNVTLGTAEVNCTKLSNPTPSTGTDSLFILEFNVTYIATSYPTPNCTIGLGQTDLLLWPHPERPYDPWNGSNSTVLLPHYWWFYTVNAVYISPGLPWHDVGISKVESSKTTVGAGYAINIAVTLVNNGNFTETLNVTAYVSSIAIGTQQVSLNSAGKTVNTFVWNTTGFGYGNYTTWAYVQPVQGETNTASNNFTGAVVQLTIPGDINGDFKVNLQDLVLLANAYESYHGDARWNPNADIDGNGVVGLTDLVTIAMNYGRHNP